MLVNEELDGSGTFIMNGLGSSYRSLTHLLTKLWSNEWRRSFFYHLLVTALNRTFAFKQMHCITEVIAKNLEFDMMRFFYELFQINCIIAERRHRLRTGSIISLFYLAFAVDKTHTLTTATHRSLKHNWVANAVTNLFSFFYTLQWLFCTRHNRHSGCNHVLTS